MRNQVILVKDYDVALAFDHQFRQEGIPFATVEAEYGDYCIKGTHATLAHHVSEYRDMPAPCIRKDVSPLTDGVILISHIDLDTLGGIALLEECYLDHSFWSSEAIIDTQGAIGLKKIPTKDDELMKVYWAWESSLNDLSLDPTQTSWDVTEAIETRLVFLNELLQQECQLPFYATYFKQFQSHLDHYLTSCVYEDAHFRLFVNESPMHFQMHREGERWIPFCLHYHPIRQTLILSDISQRIDCGTFMKEVFGDRAGGQFRIGGSPRDEAHSLFAAFYIIQLLKERLALT